MRDSVRSLLVCVMGVRLRAPVAVSTTDLPMSPKGKVPKGANRLVESKNTLRLGT